VDLSTFPLAAIISPILRAQKMQLPITHPVIEGKPRIAGETENFESEFFKTMAHSVESHSLDWVNFRRDLVDSGGLVRAAGVCV
jgi:hypothetical protein